MQNKTAKLENKIVNLTKKIDKIRKREGVNSNDEIKSLLDERGSISKKWINARKNYYEFKAFKNSLNKMFSRFYKKN